ncbi:carboxy terminal-processing peptidase [Nemorincola caseinilytica]|uniref:Carboxy terminal-processing peptidase n=2 Tax=Nemorincola caseinilytica TaxID=2054315 RepID=A0ABP8NAY0_9BACT
MLQFMKNKILIPLMVIVALGAFFSFRYVHAAGSNTQQRRALVMETVLKTIQAAHFSPRPIDDTFSARVYRGMMSAFDGEKLYFTKAEADMLKKYEFSIDDQILAGSTEFFDSFEAAYLRRVDASEKIYESILKKPFNFNTNETVQLNTEKGPHGEETETLMLNAEKADYAADENSVAERWRKHLKYRALAKYVDLKTEQDKKKENKDSANVKTLTNAELEAKARQDVLKSNQRYMKRLRKVKSDERFAFYVNKLTETEDPHTSYFPPVEKKAFDERMSGSFVGIGARLNQNDDKTTVASIIIGSPSWKQGQLKAGDEIMKVAQGDKEPVDISGYEIDDVVKLIRGEKGTEVRLTVKGSDGAVKVIPITRGVVEIEETFAKSAIIQSKNGPVGFIYLPEFYADFNGTSGRTSSKDVAAEVKKLKEAGVTGIILDLRYNGGGSLNDVVEMSGIFVGRGPVVQVKSGHSSPSVLRSRGYDTALYSGPLAIMIDQSSASASEILAAAMQDYGRAVIVGSTSFGKGTVQKMVSLDDMIDAPTRLALANSAGAEENASLGSLKLTMEKFYRVNGGSTQLKGVRPHIDMPDPYDGYDDEELGERHNKSALPWDEVPAVSYKAANSISNLDDVVAMSNARIAANPTFKLISENSHLIKKKRDENKVSLNETQYRKDQEETNSISKKLEELQKNATLLEVTNPQEDLARINLDTASVAKNKDWLKALGKDIYIAETVNIINDIKKGGMKVNMGTGMK